MKFNQLIPNLSLDLKDYFTNLYDWDNHSLFDNVLKTFSIRNLDYFLIESDTNPDINKTYLSDANLETRKLFEILKNTKFFFVIVCEDNNYDFDKLIYPNEVFNDLAGALAFINEQITKNK